MFYVYESYTVDYKDIDLTHQGQFLLPDSQIQINCSVTHDK